MKDAVILKVKVNNWKLNIKSYESISTNMKYLKPSLISKIIQILEHLGFALLQLFRILSIKHLDTYLCSFWDCEIQKELNTFPGHNKWLITILLSGHKLYTEWIF